MPKRYGKEFRQEIREHPVAGERVTVLSREFLEEWTGRLSGS